MTHVVRAALFALSFVLCPAVVAIAAETPAPPQQPAPIPAAPVAHALDPADIETFLDGLVPLQIETNDIAGATIAIVKDGKLIFAKGYGVADMKSRTPVTPETMFRIGSITKTFTWTSVMQLVEQGKLDLDADVNQYLDFKMPARLGPVTLRNLMTHRPGFQEAIKNLGAQNSGKPDLGKYIRENTPDQIYKPGTTPSYSNYGAALAGYIVERVSGEPFETYVEAHIYKPLHMTHSTLRQPLPKGFEPFMSAGYRLASGEPVPYEIVNGHPAGSQASSALDMANYMIAHLAGGAFGGERILKAETTAQMHDTVTTLDPKANGIALGFYEETRNGRRIIGHGGDTIAFHSDMHLIPSENFGFFVSYNSSGRGDTSARGPLWRKFLDRYFPDPNAPAPKVAQGSAGDVAGSYITSRRPATSIITAFGALSQATVTANADGTIEVDQLTGLNGKPKKWEPIAPLAFREANGRDQLLFADVGGRLTMLTAGAGVIVYQKTTFFESALFLLSVFGISAAVLLLNLVLWPVAAMARRHYGINQEWTFSEHLLRFLVMASSAALLTLIIGFGAVLGPLLDDPWKLDATLDKPLRMLQYIGLAGAAGSLIAVYNAAQSWTNPVRRVLGRLKETLVAAAMLGLTWFCWTMNLFDLSLRY